MPQKGWNLDLSRCIGCHACAVACKAENNTSPSTSATVMEQPALRRGRPVGVNWREVLTLEGGAYPRPIKLFVTMACMHCANPACIAACPVNPKAIVKRDSDGMVLILQDRCIGCRYCEAACPFGAPQYNLATGKVEKCTGCVHRLDAGLAPACVTTCVGRALTWVDDYDYRRDGHGTPPPGLANSALTNPSIRFGPR
jgi:anaerobic dimethyl sulfoxide reductase subunit B (iron-sulfur subunit)